MLQHTEHSRWLPVSWVLRLLQKDTLKYRSFIRLKPAGMQLHFKQSTCLWDRPIAIIFTRYHPSTNRSSSTHHLLRSDLSLSRLSYFLSVCLSHFFWVSYKMTDFTNDMASLCAIHYIAAIWTGRKLHSSACLQPSTVSVDWQWEFYNATPWFWGVPRLQLSIYRASLCLCLSLPLTHCLCRFLYFSESWL